LYLQDDVADSILEMLAGAMAELRLGDPRRLSTDIGPVIDDEARAVIEQHEQRMRREAKLIARCEVAPELHQGSYVAPQVWEIESLGQLEREIFGPVLHVIRYRPSNIERVYEEINASGYGLTLGVHSRIDHFAREVFNATRVGNTYINRDMVGAVVGVNPFGGEGLSGTGPKAGGPHYLHRFISERTFTDNVVAKGGNATLFTLDDSHDN
jgi:RHH-type proline utilization regulon transcriptional repressor/proline dehydrogenase/delta 1-pyrroline-5-carboxylate dehydrogenase